MKQDICENPVRLSENVLSTYAHPKAGIWLVKDEIKRSYYPCGKRSCTVCGRRMKHKDFQHINSKLKGKSFTSIVLTINPRSLKPAIREYVNQNLDDIHDPLGSQEKWLRSIDEGWFNRIFKHLPKDLKECLQRVMVKEERYAFRQILRKYKRHYDVDDIFHVSTAEQHESGMYHLHILLDVAPDKSFFVREIQNFLPGSDACVYSFPSDTEDDRKRIINYVLKSFGENADLHPKGMNYISYARGHSPRPRKKSGDNPSFSHFQKIVDEYNEQKKKSGRDRKLERRIEEYINGQTVYINEFEEQAMKAPDPKRRKRPPEKGEEPVYMKMWKAMERNRTLYKTRVRFYDKESGESVEIFHDPKTGQTTERTVDKPSFGDK